LPPSCKANDLAISQVAEELRATHTGERIVARFEDDEEE
jgi:uncharacterized protein YoaH (UPF0181 family)